MGKKWLGFIGIFGLIWTIFILSSMLLVYMASISDLITFNEFWVVYFVGFLFITTIFSGERFSTYPTHRSYIFSLIILTIIAVVYYFLTLFVIFPWAEGIGLI